MILNCNYSTSLITQQNAQKCLKVLKFEKDEHEIRLIDANVFESSKLQQLILDEYLFNSFITENSEIINSEDIID